MTTSGTCPVCGGDVEVTLAVGRKSGKPSLSLVCPADARHFRGFINDREFVEKNLSHHVSTRTYKDEKAN